MSRNINLQRTIALAAVLLLGTVGAVYGQQDRGGLYGTVSDDSGEALPGVTVTVTGVGAPAIMVTDAQGKFRQPSLSIGQYQLKAELEGFSTVEYPNITVSANRSTSVEITLTPAVEETITVTSESPLLDERKLSAGTSVSQVELEKIPTARDPWAILTQTPGVQSDRINVGGNESGQQAVFRAPATNDNENNFLVDGVQITDMAAIGSSPTYYDFDQFEEMQFATGGSDATKAGAGVSVNLVTKRGTNEFRGSARFFLTDSAGYFGALEQGTANVDDKLAPGQAPISGNQIGRIQDYGFEAGGPVVADRLWVWGSWGQNNINNFAAGGTPDNTILENTAIKLNAQFSSNNSGLASFNNGNKVKSGRSAGPNRPAETTFNQRGPTGIYKFEDTHVFSSSFFLTGAYDKVDGGFALTSKGVVDAAGQGISGTDPSLETMWDPNGIWRNSYYGFQSSRPSEELKLDGSYFFNTGSATSHELKFGARLREFTSNTPWAWPGRNIFTIAGANFGDNSGTDYIAAMRGSWPEAKVDYKSAWVQDTISTGKWTINAGLRWDSSDGENPGETVAANPAFPNVLPAIAFGGNDGDGIAFTTVLPRIGASYALGDERKTLLRASFSQFAGAMALSDILRVNPLGAAFAYFSMDETADHMYPAGGLPPSDVNFLFGSGFDPSDPTAASSPNINDPGLDPEITSELILAAEHSLLPEFVVGASLTWRKVDDLIDQRRLVRGPDGNTRQVEITDYFQDEDLEVTLPNGQEFRRPSFSLREDIAFTGGYLMTNGGRSRDYAGVSLNWTKRLANQWMLRGYINWTIEDTWSVPNGFIWGDRFDTGTHVGPNANEDGSNRDGRIFAVQSGGSGNKGDVWLQNSWSWNLNGMYQVAPDKPWGFNVAANLFGRQGYPLPYFGTVTGEFDGINRSISAVTDTDEYRADDILTVDFRIEKEFRTANNVGFTFSIDGFNIANETFVMQRDRNLSGGRPNYLDETLSPRIWRLGVRLNWR